MRPICKLIFLLALLGGSFRAARGDAASTAPPAEPFDVIRTAYEPHMDPADPFGLDMKVFALAQDRYKFWRGSKDLFFIWSKRGCSDWYADRDAWMPIHGDLHLGNIGTYVTEESWGDLAGAGKHLSFGMVDFDDSAIAPFQIELLQGLITLEFTADAVGVELSADDRRELVATMITAYGESVKSRRDATGLLKDHLLVSKLRTKESDTPYSEELEQYTEAGQFRPVVRNKKGKVTNVLRPLDHRADAFAQAIADACANSPEMAERMRYTNAATIRQHIRDVALRTRLGSSGSQGLKKVFVLLERPLIDSDDDVILYLKQEIPSAAERSGAVPAEARSPGRRVKELMDKLTSPWPYLNSWTDVPASAGIESYWVSFKEPWSDELDPDDAETLDDLLELARIWGTVAGATQREDNRFRTILPRLTPELEGQLLDRSAAYLALLGQQYEAFVSDERTAAAAERVRQHLPE